MWSTHHPGGVGGQDGKELLTGWTPQRGDSLWLKSHPVHPCEFPFPSSQSWVGGQPGPSTGWGVSQRGRKGGGHLVRGHRVAPIAPVGAITPDATPLLSTTPPRQAAIGRCVVADMRCVHILHNKQRWQRSTSVDTALSSSRLDLNERQQRISRQIYKMKHFRKQGNQPANFERNGQWTSSTWLMVFFWT